MWLRSRGPHEHRTKLPVCKACRATERLPRGSPGNPATGNWSEKWFSSYCEFENGLSMNIWKIDAMRRLFNRRGSCVYI